MRTLPLVALALVGCATPASRPDESSTSAAGPAPAHTPADPARAGNPELGAFSVSLAVKDLAASRAFYEALGFAVVIDSSPQNWLILRSGTTTIGLFQGMLPGNSLTFNPGWDPFCNPLPSFTDVRELQRRAVERGLTPTVRADESSEGPAFFALVDPDGNAILFDQHVPRPAQ